MSAFILRRLIQAVVVMVAVAYIAFLLFQYVGDPVVFLLGQDARPEQIRQMRADLGLDQPFCVQFWHFLLNAVQGEFGRRSGEGEEDRVRIAPDGADDGLVGHEEGHGIAASTGEEVAKTTRRGSCRPVEPRVADPVTPGRMSIGLPRPGRAVRPEDP